jgi:hypothetical protein
MKHLFLAAAVIAFAACAKGEEAPMADSPAAAVAPVVDSTGAAPMDSTMMDSTMMMDTAAKDTAATK